MSPSKRKRPPRDGEGRPARTGDGPTSNFVVRLSDFERATLRELAQRLGCSEAEAARTAIREAVHERFHEIHEPECELCRESARKAREVEDAIMGQRREISAAISSLVKESASKLRRRAKRAARKVQS